MKKMFQNKTIRQHITHLAGVILVIGFIIPIKTYLEFKKIGGNPGLQNQLLISQIKQGLSMIFLFLSGNVIGLYWGYDKFYDIINGITKKVSIWLLYFLGVVLFFILFAKFLPFRIAGSPNINMYYLSILYLGVITGLFCGFKANGIEQKNAQQSITETNSRYILVAGRKISYELIVVICILSALLFFVIFRVYTDFTIENINSAIFETLMFFVAAIITGLFLFRNLKEFSHKFNIKFKNEEKFRNRFIFITAGITLVTSAASILLDEFEYNRYFVDVMLGLFFGYNLRKLMLQKPDIKN